ncbi:hypothetical protein FN846DRAFT_906133 [Sphaerosporella brunnea]|uniref:Uncharacterized protein n=1 Tax=Sphaerosporella brunnea TaxID=1250544 RepID=A0A5J5F0F0_9PEZI|nr:hypothetical protein FN846DRAFT_906133 [Sphaerosporella brunnea]
MQVDLMVDSVGSRRFWIIAPPADKDYQDDDRRRTEQQPQDEAESAHTDDNMCPHALTAARIVNGGLAFESINDGSLYLHVLNHGNYTFFTPEHPAMAGEMIAAVLDRVEQLAGGKPEALSDGQRTIHRLNAQQSRMRYLRATFSAEYLSQLRDGSLNQVSAQATIEVSPEMKLEVAPDQLAAAKLLLAVLAEVDQVWPDFLLQSRKQAHNRIPV